MSSYHLFNKEVRNSTVLALNSPRCSFFQIEFDPGCASLSPPCDLPAERLSIIPQFEYSVWMVANLHLKDRPAGPMLAWDNIIYDGGEIGAGEEPLQSLMTSPDDLRELTWEEHVATQKKTKN